MSKKKIGLFFSCILAVSISGCGNAIPEMTEEQNSLVTEYAAGLLLQYNTVYDGRLVDTSIPPEEEKQTLADATQVDGGNNQNPEVSDNQISESVQSDSQTGDAVTTEKPSLTIAQVLGYNDIDIAYTGYQLCDSYPDVSSEADPVFTMNAATGSKLLVLNLQIVNPGTQSFDFDTLDMESKYKVILNGEKKQSTMLTMLEDDFSAMSITIDSGTTVNAVLVSEVTEDMANNLQTVALEVKMGDTKTVISNP